MNRMKKMEIETNHPQKGPSPKKTTNPNLIKGTLKKKALKFQFKRGQGQFIDQRDRQWILRTYYVLKMHNNFVDEQDDVIKNLINEISSCSLDSIENIITEDTYHIQDNRSNIQNTHQRILNSAEEGQIKDVVIRKLKVDLEEGSPVSSKDIRAWLNHSRNISVSKATLLRYTQNWGINWRRLKFEEYRKAKESVLLLREEFLQKIINEFVDCQHIRKCKCPEERKIVFLDESYIHEHHVSNFGLTIDNIPLKKPSGKGRRAVIAAAITEDGWLGVDNDRKYEQNMEGVYENGSIRYWVANVGGDYHQNFDGDRFINYFEECVLRHLTEPSLIILDRASYHVTYPEGTFYPTKARKFELQEWLRNNRIDFDEYAFKDELKMLVMCYWQPPRTIIEEMAETHGLNKFGREHIVMFLPPYHPEYNGIEMAWGRVKHFVGKNPPYNLNILLNETLPNALREFKRETASKIVKHVTDLIRVDANEELDVDELDLRMDEH
jgi:hypothetical protein